MDYFDLRIYEYNQIELLLITPYGAQITQTEVNATCKFLPRAVSLIFSQQICK
jgi:hypothetical protein